MFLIRCETMKFCIGDEMVDETVVLPRDIHIRDPFILTYGQKYYLYGTTRGFWDKSSDGFDAWYSEDLEHWYFHGEVYGKPENATWNQYNFWAPRFIIETASSICFTQENRTTQKEQQALR